MSTHSQYIGAKESTLRHRPWRRVRFRLWALLLAPAIVAMLLLVIFPKLLTGDFVEGKVVSIEESGSGFVIKLDVWTSSQTGWGTSLQYGPFSSLGTSSEPLPHWSHFIPTWPRHELITINLGLNRDKLSLIVSNPIDAILIKQGDTFLARPIHRVPIATAKTVDGKRGECVLKVSRGSRLGI
jgi:hypothetical protein